MTLVAAKPRKRPLHEQVAATLWTNILSPLKPGAKLASEAQLARNMSVSVLTLRQALSVLAHEGMIERRHGSGTYVADHGRHKGVAIGTVADPQTNSFQTRLFHLLNEIFRREGYHCRSYVAPFGFLEGWAELTEDVRYGRIAGAAMVAMNPASVGIPFEEAGVPHVGMGSTQASVELDHADLMRTAARHLVEQGCRRIALMQWSPEEPGVNAALDPFRATLAELGVPLREEWTSRINVEETPSVGWRKFHEIWNVRDEKPDGLLVTDDILFRNTAMGILNSDIKVPRDLRIVAHANKGSGLTYPFPVSFLEVDVEEWAVKLVEQLIQLMNHEPLSVAIHRLRARLIPAGSTSPDRTPATAASPIQF